MTTPDSVEVWQKLSHLLGIGRRCIHYMDVHYNNRYLESPKSNNKPRLTRQNKHIYDLLTRVTKGKIVSNRKIYTSSFFKEVMNLKSNLELSASETNKSNKATEQDFIRTTIDKILDNNNNTLMYDKVMETYIDNECFDQPSTEINNLDENYLDENYLDEKYLDENDSGLDSDSESEDEKSPIQEVVFNDSLNMKKYSYNKKALLNLQKVGNIKLLDRDIVSSQSTRNKRLDKKCLFRNDLWEYWNNRIEIMNRKNV